MLRPMRTAMVVHRVIVICSFSDTVFNETVVPSPTSAKRMEIKSKQNINDIALYVFAAPYNIVGC